MSAILARGSVKVNEEPMKQGVRAGSKRRVQIRARIAREEDTSGERWPR